MKQEIQESDQAVAASTAPTTTQSASTKKKARKPRKKKVDASSVSAAAPSVVKLEEQAVALRYTPDRGRPAAAIGGHAMTQIPSLSTHIVRREAEGQRIEEAPSIPTAYTHSSRSSVSSGTSGSTATTSISAHSDPFASVSLNYRYVDLPNKTLARHYELTPWNDYLTIPLNASDFEPYEQYIPDMPASSLASSSQTGPSSPSPARNGTLMAYPSLPTSVQASNSVPMGLSYNHHSTFDRTQHGLGNVGFGSSTSYYRQGSLPAPSSCKHPRNDGQNDFRNALDHGFEKSEAENLYPLLQRPLNLASTSQRFVCPHFAWREADDLTRRDRE
jgi:hypothetical protein